MPNPRYLSKEGEPTVELLMKLYSAKKVYFENLELFCSEEYVNKKNLESVEKIYLIGSHAQEEGWHDDTSDIDFKLVMPNAIPENLFRYKRKVLDKILCSSSEKKRWVDLYFVRQDYQVLRPRWDVTGAWNDIVLD